MRMLLGSERFRKAGQNCLPARLLPWKLHFSNSAVRPADLFWFCVLEKWEILECQPGANMAKILVIEDEAEIYRSIEDWLLGQQHVLEWAADGSLGLELLRTYTYDLVVLDVNLPGLLGTELLQIYRKEGGRTPVLMLTAQSNEEQKESGLDAGADDYLTKPFSGRELCARVRALLRRPADYRQQTMQAGGLVLNPDQLIVMKGDTEIQLRPKEFALLEFLVRHPNQAFNANALLERVWKNDQEITEEAVRITVRRLRMKVGEDGPIKTIHGAGYLLESK